MGVARGEIVPVGESEGELPRYGSFSSSEVQFLSYLLEKSYINVSLG